MENRIREKIASLYTKETISLAEQNELWQRIVNTNIWNKRKRSFLFRSIQAAAIFIILLSIAGSVYYIRDYRSVNYEKIISQNYQKSSTSIQLILDDNNRIVLPENNTSISYDNIGNLTIEGKDKSFQSSINQNKKKISLNQIIVPKGKQARVTLSDGSCIWLNSNTKMVYPIVFNKKQREIYVDGEIYLEVEKDELHPFFVKSRLMNVKVLGTSFDVCAYSSKEKSSVILVSGSVLAQPKGYSEKKIKPNECLTVSSKGVSVEEVDVSDFLVWKTGYHKYNDQALSIILKELETYYGCKFIYDDEVSHLVCSGTLDLHKDLLEILSGLELVLPIQIKENRDKEYIVKLKSE